MTNCNAIKDILRENERRRSILFATFNPITGEGSVGKRVAFHIPDYPIPTQYLPIEMMDEPFVKAIAKAGSIDKLIRQTLALPVTDDAKEKVVEQFTRLRSQYDFPFWAATFVYIKRKGGGEDCLFRLTYPQRKFVERLETLRKAEKPIRLVMLKARQWGGSTTSQIYMAWLQLVHKVGLNSLIIAHQGSTSDEIKDMFDRMIRSYPISMLHKLGDAYAHNEPKLVGVGKSGSIFRVPQRNCKIKIGTAERPDGCRGGDYNLVHLSEVGIWKETLGKKPEDIVRSACKGVLYRPYTMIVYESTANGVGNFFHKEYIDARDNPHSQFRSMFVPWYDIEQNTLPIENTEAFATTLYLNRDNANEPSNREESGRYLWWLWKQGATLEGINWYIMERAQVTQHGAMAAECPSDDVEAFVNTGAAVFDKYLVENFRKACREPRHVGDIYANADEGEEALQGLRFKEDRQGLLWIWAMPDPPDPFEIVTDRYLTVVDVGGRSAKADWSVIVVFDRFGMMDGDKPCVVAQWYGHIDIDLLAWKAAQIAAFYDNSLLVIESNTLETHDKFHDVDGDQSAYILSQIKEVYPNLYAREQSEEDIRDKVPVKYGFHTNTLTKPIIISNLIKVVREGFYIERDQRCLNEMLNYEKKQNGAYGAADGYHDDLLMTRAIGLHICFNKMELPQIIKKDGGIHAGVVSRPVSAATIG